VHFRLNLFVALMCCWETDHSCRSCSNFLSSF